ncbi:hypothetical protein ACWEU6_12880 [Streptosporangium sandarakinum]|uniref:hypothetical protein n=1 Tax=Streptosporangium sandarakinum TaxID=1260955 RepID=UPI0036850FBE
MPVGTVADNHRSVPERLDEHARSIQAAAEERAGERARIQTMAGNARRFATQVPIAVSRVFGVLGIVLTTWA